MMEGKMSSRRRAMIGCFVAAVILSVSLANAQGPVKLSGELFMAGRTPIDPPPDEPKNTHAYVTLSGPAALQMYRNMRATPETDDCQEGRTIKQVGALACSLARNGKSATCDFAVDLVKGALAGGRPC
jgi:hypothetical protein